MLTDEQIAEIRARAEAATPGPWSNTYFGGRCQTVTKQRPGMTKLSIANCSASLNGEADATFIAHARQDVPALLADREELQRQLAETRERANQIGAEMRMLVKQRDEARKQVEAAETACAALREAMLREAIESIKTRAKATPVGAEDEVKGASVYNWLMYVYLLLEPALGEDES